MADGKQNLLLSSLRLFYNDPDNCRVFLDVIQQQARYPSLRILDWLVTNYARKNNITYDHGGREINVNLSYKQQLRAYSKKQFDPFCRRGRIVFPMPDPRSCPTPPTCTLAPQSPLSKCVEITFPEEARLPQDFRSDIVVHNLVTTTGQLSFFRWAITYGILNYAVANKPSIEADMLEASKTKVKHRRTSSSLLAEKNRGSSSKGGPNVLKKAICKRNVTVVMSFQ